MPRFLCDLGVLYENKPESFCKFAKMRVIFESFVK